MDNFEWGEPGFNGGGITRGASTVRIDRLAEEGFRLTNFNVEVQCTPSRSALMTGRYATGMFGKWPKKIKAITSSDKIVHAMDLFPTIAKLTNSRIPEDRIIDGIEMGDFFYGERHLRGEVEELEVAFSRAG